MILFRKKEINSTARLGAAGERLAAQRLRKAGYRVVARNLRTTLGELDLIALAPDRQTLVIVEVKTRLLDPDGPPTPPPEANITPRKQRKLRALANQFALRRGMTDRPMRIDVVAIDWPRAGKPAVRHYINAVSG